MSASPNKHILLTGGTRGIGKATALQLLDQGHQVVITVRDPRVGQEIKESLDSKRKKMFSFVILRLDSVQSVNQDLAAILALHEKEPFDVVILNAGVMFPKCRTAPVEPTFQVNFLGNFMLCYGILKFSRPENKIMFVGVSSILLKYARWPFMPPPRTRSEMELDYGPRTNTSSGWRNYALSKLCLAQLLLDLADYPNVKTALVNPGNSPTEISKNMPYWQKMILRFFFKKTLVPVDVAAERIVHAVNNDISPKNWYFEDHEMELPIHINDEKLRLDLHEFSEKLIERNMDSSTY